MTWALAEAVGSQSVTGGFTLTLGTAASAGDLLIVAIDGYLAAPSLPTGFTAFDAATTSNGARLLWGYKIAAGGETSVTISGSSTIRPCAIFARFTGSDATCTLDGHSSNTGTSTAPSATSITTTTNGDLLLTAVGWGTLNTNWTVPSGFTQAGTTKLNPGADNLGLAYATQATAGATGAETGSFVSSTTWAAGLAAFTPAASGSTPKSGADSPTLGFTDTETIHNPMADSGTLSFANTETIAGQIQATENRTFTAANATTVAAAVAASDFDTFSAAITTAIRLPVTDNPTLSGSETVAIGIPVADNPALSFGLSGFLGIAAADTPTLSFSGPPSLLERPAASDSPTLIAAERAMVSGPVTESSIMAFLSVGARHPPTIPALGG